MAEMFRKLFAQVTMAIVGWVERHPRVEQWFVARMEASRVLNRVLVILIAGQKARVTMSADNPEGIVWTRQPDAASLGYWADRLDALSRRPGEAP
jgi:hypothetical protein